jgi:hypothetical protein
MHKLKQAIALARKCLLISSDLPLPCHFRENEVNDRQLTSQKPANQLLLPPRENNTTSQKPIATSHSTV